MIKHSHSSGSVTPNGTVWLDCDSQQTFTCCVTGQTAVWTISGLDGMNNISNQSGQDVAGFHRITTTDRVVTHSSTIAISGFTTADSGAMVECIDSSTNKVNGMANILVGELLIPTCTVDHVYRIYSYYILSGLQRNFHP